MILGENIIVMDSEKELGIYGVLPEAVLKNKKVLYKLQRKLARFPWSLQRKIKTANKLLKKYGYGNVRALTADEISGIRENAMKNAPPGSMICKLTGNEVMLN